MSETKNPRLYSLDALRGLGMLFLLLIGPSSSRLLGTVGAFQSNEFLGCLLRQMGFAMGRVYRAGPDHAPSLYSRCRDTVCAGAL